MQNHTATQIDVTTARAIIADQMFAGDDEQAAATMAQIEARIGSCVVDSQGNVFTHHWLTSADLIDLAHWGATQYGWAPTIWAAAQA